MLGSTKSWHLGQNKIGGNKRRSSERKDQIELFYLPSYSPQLNPEERLNADLKQEMGKRVPVRTQAKLREAANEHMTMLERTPERVQSYFQDRRVRYAA
jgi:transposase